MSPAPSYQGGCLCGAVRFAIEGAPTWVATCHCSKCRRAHGAGSVAWVGVEVGRFTLTKGFEVLTRYQSSEAATRSFCSRCGSPMLFQSTRWPGEMHVALGLFDAGHGLAPTAHAFFDDRAPWVHVEDGLPRRGGPDGTTPIP